MTLYKNILIIIAVFALLAIPLWMVQKPVPEVDGKNIEIFQGADNQAKDLITKIAPDYKPWFNPIMEPPSAEISSLLFAFQAALGAGFIVYFLGISAKRAKTRRELVKEAKC